MVACRRKHLSSALHHPQDRVLLRLHECDLDVRPLQLRVCIALPPRAHCRYRLNAVVQHHQHRAELVHQVVDRVHLVDPRPLGVRVLVQVVWVDELPRAPVLVVPQDALVADVFALEVDDPSQPALLYHVPPRLEEPRVPRLLAQLVHQPRPLLRNHDAPAVLHRMGGGHLRADVFPRLQGLGRHGPLLLAAYRQGDRVHVRVGEHVLVPGIRGDPSRINQVRRASLVKRWENVPDCGHLISGDPLQQSQPVDPPVAQSEQADSDVAHTLPPCSHSPAALRADGSIGQRRE